MTFKTVPLILAAVIVVGILFKYVEPYRRGSWKECKSTNGVDILKDGSERDCYKWCSAVCYKSSAIGTQGPEAGDCSGGYCYCNVPNDFAKNDCRF